MSIHETRCLTINQNAIDVIKLELTLSEGNAIPKCNANVTPVSAKKFDVARTSLLVVW